MSQQESSLKVPGITGLGNMTNWNSILPVGMCWLHRSASKVVLPNPMIPFGLAWWICYKMINGQNWALQLPGVGNKGTCSSSSPGSTSRIVWNDRQGDRFVSHIKDVHTYEQRTLPFAVYSLSPNGRTALSVDFERINNLRPGYGYAGIPDPNTNQIAPENAGVYICDLETGKKELIIYVAQMNRMPLKESDDSYFKDFYTEKNWFNHLLFNTDGSHFVFLHKWVATSKPNSRFGTLKYSSDLTGKDIRLVDGSGYTSHFIWRDTDHLMMWTRHRGKSGFFLFKDDGLDQGIIEGERIMTKNGHNTYLPGNEWFLNDTYPDENRLQHVYLYHVPTEKRIPIGDFFSDPAYTGELRTDTHPRSSPDGTKVVIDCPVGESGRQLVLMDIESLLKP